MTAVEVTVVKMAVEGLIAPIVAPFILPPVIVTLPEVMLLAFNVVPVAVANENKLVELTYGEYNVPDA